MNDEQATGTRRLGPSDLPQCLRLLRVNPAHNAYLLGQLARGALVRETVAGPFWGHYTAGRLDGIGCLGSNLVLSYPITRASITAFAEAARNGDYVLRVAMGDDDSVASFMADYGRPAGTIDLERGGQLLFSLSRGDLCAPTPSFSLRAAEVSEVEAVMALDRVMIQEELGFNPFAREARVYREGWLRRLREARAWVVGPEGGPYRFKIEQSATSEEVVQISGVVTPSAHRGQGVGTDGVAQMCAILLRDVAIVSLYVHEANIPAVRLYHRLGFKVVGKIRSVWFHVS